MVYLKIADSLLKRDLAIESPTLRRNPGRKIGDGRDHLDERVRTSRHMRDPLIHEDAEIRPFLVREERRKSEYLHEVFRTQNASRGTRTERRGPMCSRAILYPMAL